MSKLKACPFCGGEAEILDWQDKNSVWERNWSVSCFDCGVEMPSTESEETAMELWNKRADIK